jgi:AI-2 transport protein TqsA
VVSTLTTGIPHVGPIVATLLPLPVVLVSRDNNAVQVFLALVLPGLTHFLLGHLLEPRIMGDSLDLHPITVGRYKLDPVDP